MTILKFLDELHKSKFYGRVILHYRGGRVAAAEKQEEVVITSSDSDILPTHTSHSIINSLENENSDNHRTDRKVR